MKSLFFLVCLYLMVVGFVYLAQRHIQYYPSTSSPQAPASYGLPEMQALRLQTADGLNNLAWFAPPKEFQTKVIVYFHGNAGDISDRALKIRPYLDQGYGVMQVEYRGFGGNEGSISEAGFYQDARAAIDWLLNKYPVENLIIYGESIGTGTAVQMATEYKASELILEAPFSSASELGQILYPWLPVKYLIKDRFESIKKIQSINMPLLIVHGTHDEVIPVALAEKLFAAASEPKLMHKIAWAQHNDLYEFDAAQLIMAFISQKDGRHLHSEKVN